MLTYEEILYSVTNILSNNFECDVFIADEEGAFDNECLFVSIVPVSSKPKTLKTNEESLIISIKYFGNGSKLKDYETANKLKNIFNRNLKVKDRCLTISSVEPNFLTDEIGNMLDFLVYTSYCDDILTKEENYENMQDINLNMKG